jgi:oligopeptide transport system substrate-binding protein
MAAIRYLLEEEKKQDGFALPCPLHPTFQLVYEKLQKWVARFPHAVDETVFKDLFLFYLLATKEYLDHRSPTHLFRLVLSIHVLQKKLLRSEISKPNQRDLKVRWIPTNLFFPFSSKSVLGCLIGFNLMSRYELFDEENILLALQKHLPQLRLVKESSYRHTAQRGTLKTFYLEMEKKDGSPFSPLEQSLLKANLEEKFKNSVQTLSPSVFMRVNEEEVYKHILVLSQEIQSIRDLPQAYITFDRQTGNEIVFRVTLVYVAPMHRFSLKERFTECTFSSERASPVRTLDGHSIQAHIFRLSLARDPSLLRSDGSLDFYSARRRVGALITSAIGEFRDYNGGILIKQQELLDALKGAFPETAEKDLELMESFFYAITPLEKQVLLNPQTLAALFKHFLEVYKERLPVDLPYVLRIIRDEQKVFLIARGHPAALSEIVSGVLQSQSSKMLDLAYNVIPAGETSLFSCSLSQTKAHDIDSLIQEIQDSLNSWYRKAQQRQTLKIALEYTPVSLDPRIGGENISGDILHFLFEGFTRFNEDGAVENGIAESIEISPNQTQYIFRLRHSFWNDGTLVSAYDFEYAWKKILSPDFKTSFADYFYHIKNAKEAKEGKCSLSDVGIQVIDDRALKVELVRPTPYFLQLTAHQLFSPIHRFIDQQYPQWPYQAEKNYPCNGPFQLKINQPTQGYQFVKNPLYWDADRVKFDQVTLSVMNSSQAVQAFQKKEVDWIGSPFGGWYSSYNPGKGDKLLTFPNSWVLWNVFNVQAPLFSNLKVRQGFAHAIQRSEIVSNSFMPLNAARTIFLPHYRENKHSLFPEFSPKKGAQLFNEGLEELGMTLKDLPPLRLTFVEKGIREYAAVCLKKHFERCLGIVCELEPLPWGTVFKKMSSGDFQMGLVHWNSWVDDPIHTLNAFKFMNHETNFSKWENPKFQELLDLGQKEVNPFQRSFYLLQAEELLSKEMPVVPIFFQPYQALVKKDLNVIYRAPSGPFNIGKSFYKQGG